MKDEFELAGPEIRKITLNQLIVFCVLFTIAITSIMLFVHSRSKEKVDNDLKKVEGVVGKP